VDRWSFRSESSDDPKNHHKIFHEKHNTDALLGTDALFMIGRHILVPVPKSGMERQANTPQEYQRGNKEGTVCNPTNRKTIAAKAATINPPPQATSATSYGLIAIEAKNQSTI
jgi:hypothetical protein